MIIKRVKVLTAGEALADVFRKMKCERVGVDTQTLVGETELFTGRIVEIYRNLF
jgi:hypothetical protein